MVPVVWEWTMPEVVSCCAGETGSGLCVEMWTGGPSVPSDEPCSWSELGVDFEETAAVASE